MKKLLIPTLVTLLLLLGIFCATTYAQPQISTPIPPPIPTPTPQVEVPTSGGGSSFEITVRTHPSDDR